MNLQDEYANGIDGMNKVSECKLITDLEIGDVEYEIDIDEGNVNIESIVIPE